MKIAGLFGDKYIEYEIGNYANLTINEYVENNRPYIWDMIDKLMMTK